MAVLEQLSATLTRALENNSQKLEFIDLDVTAVEPGTGAFVAMEPVSVYSLGKDAALTVQQLKIIPFAGGEPGGEFWMRVWGWCSAGDSTGKLWFPVLLAEVSCRTSTRSGLPNRVIRENEYLCDWMGVTAGVAYIVAPERSLIGWMTVPTLGAQLVQFDFMIGEEPCFPNALWARA